MFFSVVASISVIFLIGRHSLSEGEVEERKRQTMHAHEPSDAGGDFIVAKNPGAVSGAQHDIDRTASDQVTSGGDEVMGASREWNDIHER